MEEPSTTMWDGKLLRIVDTSLPSNIVNINGAQVLKLAEDRASLALLGVVFTLPNSLTSFALRRIGVSKIVAFCTKQLHRSEASSILRNYITTIAHQLDDDPIGVHIMDGRSMKELLGDGFPVLAKEVFDELDTEDQGKIVKDDILNALINIGVEPISEFPMLGDIIKKHGAEGKEEVGPAQFLQLLQSVFQELADSLAKKPVIIVQNFHIMNGSEIRKLLADERRFDYVLKETLMEKYVKRNEPWRVRKVMNFLEEHEDDFGLPPLQDNIVMASYYKKIFTAMGKMKYENGGYKSENDEFLVMLRIILEQFADLLKRNPVYYDYEEEIYF